MGLETPLYLDQFVSGNPAGGDQRHEGDDHLRNLKIALKNTFPGLNGRAFRTRAVTASGPINISDNMTLLNVSGGLTLTPAAAATLGNGFMALVMAGGGNVTIDPVEPINGAASLVVPSGYIAILFSDGGEFYTLLTGRELPVAAQAFPIGTRMVFQQTAAPTGWTKVTSAVYNNASLRLTTGTVGTGGVTDFTTIFADRNVGNTALSVAQLAPHVHGGVWNVGGSQQGNAQPSANPNIAGTESGLKNTDSEGSGATHTHSITMSLKYADCIIASKD